MKIQNQNISKLNKNQVYTKKALQLSDGKRGKVTCPLKFENPKIDKGNFKRDIISFGAPVKSVKLYGENRLITMRHDIFKDFSKVVNKLSKSTKELFKNINTNGRSFMDAFDELDENTRKSIPNISITNLVNFSDDKIVSVKTIDNETYTVIVRPNNKSNSVAEVISEPLNIEPPYILNDLGVRIQKLSKNTFHFSQDFMMLYKTSKLVDPEDETDLVVTKEGAFVETENANYVVQNINDMKLPFVAHIDDTTYAKQINDEMLQVCKIADDRELSNFMMNIMIHEIIPYINKNAFNTNETRNAISLIKNIEDVATNRIKTGSNPAFFSNVFKLKNSMYNVLQTEYIKDFLNLKQEKDKIILDTTQWSEEKHSEFLNLDKEALNIVFKDITEIKGNLTISEQKDCELPSLENIDGSLTILEGSDVKTPKLKVIRGDLIIQKSKVEMPDLEEVNIIQQDNSSKVRIPVKTEKDALYREFKVINNTLMIDLTKTNKLFENRSSEQLNLLFQDITTIHGDFALENHKDLNFPSLVNINGSLIIKNAKDISFPKLNFVKENLVIENSDYIGLPSIYNIGSDYIEENSNKVFMKHTFRTKMIDMHEAKKEREFAKRRIAPIINSGMSLEQQRLQLDKEIEFERLYTERAHQERMDKLKEKKAAMKNALKEEEQKARNRHLERQDELKRDYLRIMDKHMTNLENLEQKKLEYNERIEKARLEIEDAHFKINKRLEELAISSEERKQALLIEAQNRRIEQEMKNAQKWIEIAYAQIEEQRIEHQDEMMLQLMQLQSEYTLKVEEYKQIQNQQILQIEDARRNRNLLQRIGDTVQENGGYLNTIAKIPITAAKKLINGISNLLGD